jgi:hypothetical protein
MPVVLLPGNTNLLGYLNNWNHREKYGFKITDIEKIQKSDGNDFEWERKIHD